MNTFQNKMVAVLNKSVPTGNLMNALAHMSIGLGGHLGGGVLRLSNYQDQEGGVHPHISEIPFIILEANSNKIRQLRLAALEQGIAFADFNHTMTGGTYEEQMRNAAQTAEKDLTYYGIVLFGEWEKVTLLTKKFSLWKS